MMRIVLIIMLLVSGCTVGSFNPETKKFFFMSTKEFDSFEIKYKHVPDSCVFPSTEITIEAKKVKAFEGQKAVVDIVKSSIKPF